MKDADDLNAGREIIVESSKAVARAETDSRGLSRPPIPKTIKLSDPHEIIAVDLSEGMDEAAAVEAADPRSDNLWLKAIRSLIVGCTLATAWWLLPHESPPRPPTPLPEALQSEISVSPEQAAVEATATAIFTKDGPEAAIAALEKCVTPGPATHRAWRTFLTALEQRDHDDELLTQARAYAEKYPDRLEAAHFVAEALLRQDMDDHREGFLRRHVSSEFKDELESAQQQLSQALDLLYDHKSDWSSATRSEWHDALLFDSARLCRKRWRCEGSPFEHDLRDQAIAEIERMHQKDAPALELKRDIYVRIMERWPVFFHPTTMINGKQYSKQRLRDFIAVLNDKLSTPANGD